MSDLCPFCIAVTTGNHHESDAHAAVLDDNYPVLPGHTLIVPRRHVRYVDELTDQETSSMLDLARQARQRLRTGSSRTEFTMGLNDGPLAGQTIGHVHLHVIPRTEGDLPDPRGGIRLAFPNGDWWNHTPVR